MNRSEANRTYSETLEKESRRFEKIGGAAASAFTDSSWSAMKGLQEYNERLLEITQSNVNAMFEFLRGIAAAKSPSEFIAAATEHASRQYEMSSLQAKELTALAQKLALGSTEPARAYAAKTADKLA